MMAMIEQRARRLADARRDRLIARLAVQLREDVPGVAATAEHDRLILAGRGLTGRWLREPRLRFFGRLGR